MYKSVKLTTSGWDLNRFIVDRLYYIVHLEAASYINATYLIRINLNLLSNLLLCISCYAIDYYMHGYTILRNWFTSLIFYAMQECYTIYGYIYWARLIILSLCQYLPIYYKIMDLFLIYEFIMIFFSQKNKKNVHFVCI